jgi:putative glutamine amidotransferase
LKHSEGFLREQPAIACGKILAFSVRVVKMAEKKAAPWIGMPAQMDPGGNKQYLRRDYTDAVLESGGVPIMIPLPAAPQSIRSVAERLDGILLAGNNSDIDPGLYHAPRLDACGPVQPLRDQMDFFLLETAVKRKIPILGICYGMQSLNVFLGGSLIQDIPTTIDTSVQHGKEPSQITPKHKIAIASGSMLESIAGGLDVMVNSTHHQGVERPGEGLDAIAHAPDGVIESVSGTSQNHWILGVQWHPEAGFSGDDFSRKIFADFLAHCRAVRGIDEGTHT